MTDKFIFDIAMSLIAQKYKAAKKSPIILSWDDANLIIDAFEYVMKNMVEATESEQLRKENEELKAKMEGLLNIIDKQHSAQLELQAKLDKAKIAVETPCKMVDADLMFCLGEFDNIPYQTVQKIARATADIIAQRARTTLEEIE